MFAAATFTHDYRLTVPIGLSIGAATFPTDGRTAAELIAVADAGLYRMKRRPAHRGAARRPDGPALGHRPSTGDAIPPEVPPGRLAAEATGPSSSSPNVTPPTEQRPSGGAEDPRIRRSWLIFAGTFGLLCLIAVFNLSAVPRPLNTAIRPRRKNVPAKMQP